MPAVRQLIGTALTLAALMPSGMSGQSATHPATDLDGLMAQALARREVDRRTLGDYVLDEVETFQLLGPGRTTVTGLKREYTWYVRDGIHVRSPVRFDGVPIAEAERRQYEDKWFVREQERRENRAQREAELAREGKPPRLGPAALNEPRFVSESYFLEFKFEPGNYYLTGHERLDRHDVLRIDYYPTHLFDDDEGKESKEAKESKEQRTEQDIERKMNKTALVTLWVDPTEHRIVKYTFDNVWMDFLPAAWLVRVDDLRASMEMGQPFDGVWLPRNISIHGGITLAAGSFEVAYRREFSNYRKADVSSRVTVPSRSVIR